eukprot:TRINITY_DN7028_c0_g1_i1.p1 TRINITY_DN7028_c0_g1~~TRINITY_DN7028_c0_g1_i1.p1  ORF type:complete len:213 (+),score=18.08 TRINITY_DN7028_c0_g1_i1:103-741(+)
MNIFRALGDLIHLLSFFILLVKIRATKNCQGISLKSQELYALVFVTRYLDLFWNFDWYLTTMKIIYISASFYTIYLIRIKYKHTYDREHDSFKNYFIIIPCAALALLINQEFIVSEILWAFSIYLEAVAIFPQLILLQRTGDVENITADYIFSLGAYRALYLINWIYRYFTEDDYVQWIVWLSGLVQTGLYCDFFYYYIRSKYYGKKMTLPA